MIHKIIDKIYDLQLHENDYMIYLQLHENDYIWLKIKADLEKLLQ